VLVAMARDPESATNGAALTGGRLLARNTLWSLAGQAAPLLVALVTIPPLIRGLGTDRFGVLTLTWVLVGYFGLFDLGLGRALTQVVAGQLGNQRQHEMPALVWTALLVLLGLGVVGGVALGLLSPVIVTRMLRVPAHLEGEALQAFQLIATAVPFIVSTAGLAGLLAAYQRFRAINAIRIPTSIYSFAAPLAVLPFSRSIAHVVAVLVAGRAIGWGIHLLVCLRSVPAMREGPRFDRTVLAPLLRSGSWMTITNVVGPLMIYLDRFVIGAWVSLSAVAWYATPYEVATKLSIVAGPVAGVLFPAFATSFAHDADRMRLLFFRGVKYLVLILFPAVLAIVMFSREGLTIWLDADFASHSALVLQVLSVGVFFNCLAQMPFALIQGVGRADQTAVLHLIQLPPYLLGLWWLTRRFGIDGAAVAWLIRSAFDFACQFVMARQFLGPNAGMAKRVAFPSALSVIAFGLAMALQTTRISIRAFALIAVLSAFAFFAWSGLRAERRILRDGLFARGV
jgi:O-antigen/teichoic acid export membrane protein